MHVPTSSEMLLAAKMTQNMQKVLQKELTLQIWLNLCSEIMPSSKMAVVYRKSFLPKTFQINFRKSHKISKKFDEKQKIGRQR